MLRILRRKYLELKNTNDIFSVLFDMANENLQKEILYSKNTNQRKDKHPEGSVYNHTRIVTNKLHKKYRNINLTLSGLFHDLGKNHTTIFNHEKGFYTAYEHEKVSVDIIDKNRRWVKKMGGNIDLIKYVVKNHMRIKYLNEMRSGKRKRFESEKYFKYVQMFTNCDDGGF